MRMRSDAKLVEQVKAGGPTRLACQARLTRPAYLAFLVLSTFTRSPSAMPRTEL